jgi:hypothetical protein
LCDRWVEYRYRRDCLLHIGIVDTKGTFYGQHAIVMWPTNIYDVVIGRVYNFDERGRVMDESWAQAIHVPLQLEGKLASTFDDDLLAHLLSEQQMTTFSPYHCKLFCRFFIYINICWLIQSN